MNPTQNFIHFITQPYLSIILLTIGILGIAVEITTQHGIAGLIGLTALGLFFGAYLTANPLNFWFLILFLIGCGLILFELHVAPGHGVSAILGIAAVLASLFLVMGGGRGGALAALAAKEIAFSLGIAVVIFLMLLRYLPKAPLFQKLILKTSLETPVLSPTLTAPDEKENLKKLIGKTGIALSDLRPLGKIQIENAQYSAISEDGFLSSNTKIKVAALDGTNLKVNKIPS
jgi:membrane-bound serine protease (ClpP class)